jgi:uncharacterized protein YndB with AHSA1/START domain
MPTIHRSRTLAATPDDVWATVRDPHHLPRWWPRVVRVEGVDDRGFTQVLRTRRGRNVRADFRIDERRARELVRWSQEVEGTPFERVLAAASTEIRLGAASESGTVVTIETYRKLRGVNRLGGFMLRRATRRQLDEALDALEALHR